MTGAPIDDMGGGFIPFIDPMGWEWEGEAKVKLESSLDTAIEDGGAPYAPPPYIAGE